MEETAHAHVAFLQGFGGSKAESDRYREAQVMRSQLVNEQTRRLQAETARKAAVRAARERPARAFVNSFGEATTRYVTSGTYERAIRRTEREVQGFMGRR